MSLESSAAEFIKKFEGYSGKAYWDVNAWRIGYGSDTIELPNGTYRKVVQGDTTTVDLATKDLSRRLSQEFIPKVQTKISEPYWSKLPTSAQVALMDFAYNYGNVTKQAIVDSARTGDLNLLSQSIVDSTYNDNANLSANVRAELRQRRQHEADTVKNVSAYIDEATKFTSKNKTPLIIAGVSVMGLLITWAVYNSSK